MLKTTHDMVQEAQSEAEKAKQTAAAKEAAGLEAQVGPPTLCLFAPGVLAACNWPGFTATYSKPCSMPYAHAHVHASIKPRT